jgi:aspartate kinase
MLGAYGFLSKVFEVFSRYETSVDIVTTSEVSISLTIDDDTNLTEISRELEKIGDIEVKQDYAIICSVGEGIRDTAGIAAKFFGVLKGVNILMVSIGASEVNIIIIVKETDLNKAVTLLHQEFFDNLIDNHIFY